jgi:RimJ/RimL family protein N-acetyltransferase
MTHTAATGSALRLVPLSLDHLASVMTWVNDHEVMQYFAARQTDITEDEERRYIAGLIASKTDRAWSIFEGDTYVGQCSLNQIYWPARNGRLFIVIARAHQGRGLGPRAVSLLLHHAWNELKLHKVWLIVRRDNRDALAMYTRLGFDFEGVLPDEYFVHGRFHDMVRMSVIEPPTREPDPDTLTP